MVKTLYKEEKMPVGLHNSWRARFSSEVLSELSDNQSKKENFLENYFAENKEVGEMVLSFVLCENTDHEDVEKVSLAPKQSPATSFFKSHFSLMILTGFSAICIGHLLGAFNMFNLLNSLKFQT